MYTYTSMERIQRKETYLWTEKWNMGSSLAMTFWGKLLLTSPATAGKHLPGWWKTTQEKNYIHSKMGENWDIYIYIGWWFGTWFFFHRLGIIIPTDFHIFQRGRYTTNQHNYKTIIMCLFFLCFSCLWSFWVFQIIRISCTHPHELKGLLTIIAAGRWDHRGWEHSAALKGQMVCVDIVSLLQRDFRCFVQVQRVQTWLTVISSGNAKFSSVDWHLCQRPCAIADPKAWWLAWKWPRFTAGVAVIFYSHF